MVVPVLITSCHVSENPKKGPDAAQTSTRTRQARKAAGLPVILAVVLANLAKNLSTRVPGEACGSTTVGLMICSILGYGASFSSDLHRKRTVSRSDFAERAVAYQNRGLCDIIMDSLSKACAILHNCLGHLVGAETINLRNLYQLGTVHTRLLIRP